MEQSRRVCRHRVTFAGESELCAQKNKTGRCETLPNFTLSNILCINCMHQIGEVVGRCNGLRGLVHPVEGFSHLQIRYNAVIPRNWKRARPFHSKKVFQPCVYKIFSKGRDVTWNHLEKSGSRLLKLRSNGLSCLEFRPRFALFPVVGTGRIDASRGLVSASVVSRVVVVNRSHIKDSRRHHCIRSLERCRDICKATRRRNGTSVRIPQTTVHKCERTSSDSKFGQATRRWKGENSSNFEILHFVFRVAEVWGQWLNFPGIPIHTPVELSSQP
ncbi:hypothetical protein AVEN_209736-1 [Araneus ventricosus]|uniref:Uncharacterized protein n=1 Tax=Araneus ventricosus TaxID=182803 RepID=A0A4Y2CCS3_ARAVE|nr:hypothetical protein AVEN_209736-1 [Araneus ventricosus]